MRISDWSSDVCSSDLILSIRPPRPSISAPQRLIDKKLSFRVVLRNSRAIDDRMRAVGRILQNIGLADGAVAQIGSGPMRSKRREQDDVAALGGHEIGRAHV